MKRYAVFFYTKDDEHMKCQRFLFDEKGITSNNFHLCHSSGENEESVQDSVQLFFIEKGWYKYRVIDAIELPESRYKKPKTTSIKGPLMIIFVLVLIYLLHHFSKS